MEGEEPAEFSFHLCASVQKQLLKVEPGRVAPADPVHESKLEQVDERGDERDEQHGKAP